MYLWKAVFWIMFVDENDVVLGAVQGTLWGLFLFVSV